MPLLVEGRRVRLPQSAGDLVRAHPLLEERARLLRGQSVQQVGPQGLLYVQQRELAAASPQDGSISILGSDDATTCHIVVLRHTGNGATCLTHCDGSDTKAEVPLIMSSIKSFSDHAPCGRLEVHLVGGFSDDRQLSQKLTHQLLSEFDRQEDDIHLVTLCVTELNDREENEKHFPIIYGIAVNIKTAEIYRASFPDRGPEEELRAARALTGGPMISIYDAKTEQLRIGPYSWMPFPHVDFWLQQDDKQILERQTEHERRRIREREGDTESETGSRLCTVSTEPNAGLELTEKERERQSERVRVNEHEQGRCREREKQNLKQAPGFELSAQRLPRGSNPRTVRSQPEPQSTSRAGADRGGDTESEAGSRL
uniref:N-terminal asparagine amidase n=1 Tax=Felis catus TaxID=9685 RepID=A0ABI7Y0K8_FELCA